MADQQERFAYTVNCSRLQAHRYSNHTVNCKQQAHRDCSIQKANRNLDRKQFVIAKFKSPKSLKII